MPWGGHEPPLAQLAGTRLTRAVLALLRTSGPPDHPLSLVLSGAFSRVPSPVSRTFSATCIRRGRGIRRCFRFPSLVIWEPSARYSSVAHLSQAHRLAPSLAGSMTGFREALPFGPAAFPFIHPTMEGVGLGIEGFLSFVLFVRQIQPTCRCS